MTLAFIEGWLLSQRNRGHAELSETIPSSALRESVKRSVSTNSVILYMLAVAKKSRVIPAQPSVLSKMVLNPQALYEITMTNFIR